jgi:hypothetical protein
MNDDWRGCETKRSSSNLKYHPTIFLEGLTIIETSIRIDYEPVTAQVQVTGSTSLLCFNRVARLVEISEYIVTYIRIGRQRVGKHIPATHEHATIE